MGHRRGVPVGAQRALCHLRALRQEGPHLCACMNVSISVRACSACVRACIRASFRPSICLCKCPRVRPCASPSVRPCVRSCVRPFVRLSTRASAHLRVRASICPCVRSCARASVRPWVRLPARPQIRVWHLFLCPPVQTNFGANLVAVNPFKQLPLYDDATLQSYARTHACTHACMHALVHRYNHKENSTPHVYAIAEASYRCLCTRERNTLIQASCAGVHAHTVMHTPCMVSHAHPQMHDQLARPPVHMAGPPSARGALAVAGRLWTTT